MSEPPLIAHVIYRLGVGGLENGLVNLINRTPPNRYRHAVICLKDATDFSQRIRAPNVPLFCLHRKEGQDFGLFVRLFSLLRELKPAIVHTRNLAALECQVPAWLAGVPLRVHGEHGWDVFDPDGSNWKYQWLRRLHRPLIQRYIPLSRHLEAYLRDRVGVADRKMRRICNGVDTKVFHPATGTKSPVPGCPFPRDDSVTLIGAVGRMHGVKDQITLTRAFIRLVEIMSTVREHLGLVLVGDGPLREQARAELARAGLEDRAWLTGERDDIADLMRILDIFVLPSQAEGISNTILEAMATGLPVVATAVGGNPDLVINGETGRLVPPSDPLAMAEALAEYLADPQCIASHGAAGLARARDQFSLDGMVQRYLAVYDELMGYPT